MIRARAPGKVVLWGEYAVLHGAPALVMAVDRYAECAIVAGGNGWRFSAAGHPAAALTLDRDRLLDPEPPDGDAVWAVAWHVLQALGGDALPPGAEVRFDTAGFSSPATGKLGLGSSAAVCTAAAGAFARLLGQPATLAAALEAHARLQGGYGSGVDVAAAWHGGLLRFQRHAGASSPAVAAAPWALPDTLALRFVFSGRSASTRDHLARLQRWQSRGGRAELDALADASAALFDSGAALPLLAHYVGALRRLDEAAELGIFSAPHQRLAQLATAAGVVYKPCGAGGGDLGAAFAHDARALDEFARRAADHGFVPLALETASHGIEVTG